MRYLVITVILLYGVNVFAAPSVSSVTGTLTHEGTITVSGADFGSKSPATPLHFDDGEDRSDGDAPTSTPNATSQVGPSEWYPIATRNGENVPAAWRITWEELPYTPEGESGSLTTVTSGPHSNSSMILTGGHYWDISMDGDNNPARDVTITFPNEDGAGNFKPRWFMHFYYRVNSDYPECGNMENHKLTVIQSSLSAYTSTPYGTFHRHDGYNAATDTPCHDDATIRTRQSVETMGDFCDDLHGDWAFEDRYKEYSPNPKYGWVKFEEVIIDDTVNGGKQIRVNNQVVWNCDTAEEWYTDDAGGGSYGIASVTVGGYMRQNNLYGSGGEQNSDAHRFFDDLYIDSTLSRVMICNNADYDSATICEPQIPTAWGASSITATANEGNLDFDETVYLYVFDSDNSYNSTGFEVNAINATTTGTALDNITETDIVNGGKDLIFTLSSTEWVATIGADNAITTAFLAIFDGDKIGAGYWDTEMSLDYTHLTRTSATVLTLTLPATAGYDCSETETVSIGNIPTTATEYGEALTPSPNSFTIGVVGAGSTSKTVIYNANGSSVVYDVNGKAIN